MPPTDRRSVFAGIEGFAEVDGLQYALSTNQYVGAIFPDGFQNLLSFELDEAVTWKFRCGNTIVSKRLEIVSGENAVKVSYRNEGTVPARLSLRPLLVDRSYHENFYVHEGFPLELSVDSEVTAIGLTSGTLRLSHPGANATLKGDWYYRCVYERETERGLNDREDRYCPVELQFDLSAGGSATIGASIGDIAIEVPINQVASGTSVKDRLSKAVSLLVASSQTRSTILAGYPWFTDWGRDTMISLPGFLCATGRHDIARNILHGYASQIKDGLIPNRFVEGHDHPDYNTVDATLWFVNAIHYTLAREWDESFATSISPCLAEIFTAHIEGTLFNIRVDPRDGLLCQGSESSQLTWMDAKIGDHAMTPRMGKPIEINALWVNALNAMIWIQERLGHHDQIPSIQAAARLASENFESKFWNEDAKCYRDVVDPIDDSIRPNQVIAMSLPLFEMDQIHCRTAMEVVGRELLTPFGLRTLAPGDSRYRPRYEGSMNDRDSAYHLGTVWPWLLGPYATALAKYANDRAEAKRVLKSVRIMLDDYGLDGIAEVYDGDAPQRAGGCPWQAWSVCEILRAWVDDLEGS